MRHARASSRTCAHFAHVSAEVCAPRCCFAGMRQSYSGLQYLSLVLQGCIRTSAASVARARVITRIGHTRCGHCGDLYHLCTCAHWIGAAPIDNGFERPRIRVRSTVDMQPNSTRHNASSILAVRSKYRCNRRSALRSESWCSGGYYRGTGCVASQFGLKHRVTRGAHLVRHTVAECPRDGVPAPTAEGTRPESAGIASIHLGGTPCPLCYRSAVWCTCSFGEVRG